MNLNPFPYIMNALLPRPKAQALASISYKAVEQALAKTDPQVEKFQQELKEVPPIAPATVIKVPDTADPGSPEYHLGLATQMVEKLEQKAQALERELIEEESAHNANINELSAQIDEAIRQHRERRTEKQKKLAGVRTSQTFYASAPDRLAPPDVDKIVSTAAAVEPKRRRKPGEPATKADITHPDKPATE